jgi:hypothetical protein
MSERERERRDNGREPEKGREDGGRVCVCVRVHIYKCSIIYNLGHVKH